MKGIDLDILNPQLESFDFEFLSQSLVPERDLLFKYLGSQILYDRYLLRDRSENRTIFELPQFFWMRVAMGLALNKPNMNEEAVSFYHVLSKMDLVSSTPTLFKAAPLCPIIIPF